MYHDNNVIFYFAEFNYMYTRDMAQRHQHAEKHAEQQNELVNYNTMHNNINNYMIMITLLKCK